MPQMPPLSWIYLFIVFITIFMIMNTLHCFSFTCENTILKSSPKINWKW